jgi:hypothetical protein
MIRKNGGGFSELKAQSVKRKAGKIRNLTFRRIANPGIKRKNPQALIGGFSENLNLRFSLGR